MKFIEAIEAALGMEAEKNFIPMQPGDVPVTSADIQALMDDVGFRPDTPLQEGVQRFVDWYREYYHV
jgi:UDP-glucuronate 4-epimerase